MTLLALPDPKELTLADTREVCAGVIDLANECDDVEMVIEMKKAFQAFAEYLALHDAAREGRATMLYLEARIGELAGPASETNGRPLPDAVKVIHHSRLSEFRQMAAHPDVVDRIVEESTEKEPPSRAKVLNAIKELDRVAREAKVEEREWKDGLAEQREWAATFKAKPGDDWRRRDKAEGAAISFTHNARTFLTTITADDLSYALDTGLTHVAERLRADLNAVFDQLDDYRKAL